MISAIAGRDIAAMFRTPQAWLILAFVQFICAYQFLAQIDLYVEHEAKLRGFGNAPGVTEVVVVPTVGVCALILLFMVPLVTMHAFAGERRAGTLNLLYSAPVSPSAIVVGKFLAVAFLFTLQVLFLAVMQLTLFWGTALDLGVYVGGLIALTLLLLTYASVGILFSAMLTQPAAAAGATFAVLLTLWMLDWATRLGTDAGLFSQISTAPHFQRLARGLLDSADVVYFVVIIGFCTAVTIWWVGEERRG